VLGRQVAKLGSACAKQEASLSDKSAVYHCHLKDLEEAVIRLAQGELDDEAGRSALDALRNTDQLHQQIQQLEAENAVRATVATELDEVQRQLRAAEQREMDRATVESKDRATLARVDVGMEASDGLASAELEAKVRQLQKVLSLAKMDLAAVRLERDKALAEAENTKVSANSMLRASHKDLADEKGAREMCNTKAAVAQREAHQARSARENDKKRMQQQEHDTSALHADVARLQKQLDELRTKFDAERAQMRDKANSMIKDKHTELSITKKEAQDRRHESDNMRNALSAREAEARDLAAQLRTLQGTCSSEVAAIKDIARVSSEQLAASEGLSLSLSPSLSVSLSHTETSSHIHTHTLAHMHTHTRMHTHALSFSPCLSPSLSRALCLTLYHHSHTYTQPLTPTYKGECGGGGCNDKTLSARTHAHTHIHTRPHTYTHTHTFTHTHTHAHKHAYPHIHPHTHTPTHRGRCGGDGC